MYRKVLEAAQASHSHSLSQKKKTAKGKVSRSPSPALLRGSTGDVSGRASVGAGLGVGYDDLEEYLRKNFPNSALYRSMSQSQQNYHDLHPSPWRPPNTYQKPLPRHSTSPSTIPVTTPQTSYTSLSTSLPLTTARYAPLVTRNQATSTSQPLTSASNKTASTTSTTTSTTLPPPPPIIPQNKATSTSLSANAPPQSRLSSVRQAEIGSQTSDWLLTSSFDVATISTVKSEMSRDAMRPPPLL